MPAANISVYYDNQADVDGQFNTVVYAGAVPPNQVGPPVSAQGAYMHRQTTGQPFLQNVLPLQANTLIGTVVARGPDGGVVPLPYAWTSVNGGDQFMFRLYRDPVTLALLNELVRL